MGHSYHGLITLSFPSIFDHIELEVLRRLFLGHGLLYVPKPTKNYAQISNVALVSQIVRTSQNTENRAPRNLYTILLRKIVAKKIETERTMFNTPSITSWESILTAENPSGFLSRIFVNIFPPLVLVSTIHGELHLFSYSQFLPPSPNARGHIPKKMSSSTQHKWNVYSTGLPHLPVVWNLSSKNLLNIFLSNNIFLNIAFKPFSNW